MASSVPAKPRRSKGDGSIRQIKPKLWRARMYFGSDELGRRQSKDVYGKDRSEVNRKLRELQNEQDRGDVPVSTSKTVDQFFTAWLANHVQAKREDSTYDGHERTYRLHIKPHLGHLQLTKLTSQTIEAFHRALANSKCNLKRKDGAKVPLGPRTQRKAHGLLSQGLDYAVRTNLIHRNPCDVISAPTYHASEMRTLTMQELHKVLDAATGTKMRPMCALGAFCGLREGEIFGLTWKDIDFDAQTISIRRSARQISGVKSIAKTKTKAGKRNVLIPKPALEALLEWKAQLGKVESKALVFPNKAGKAQSRQNFLQRDYYPLLQRAKVAQVRFHDLRHSVATYYLSLGVNPKVVQEILGHAHISTTLGIYSHVLPTMQADANALLTTAFENAIEGKIGGSAVFDETLKMKKPC